jgi:hypothetical protein
MNVCVTPSFAVTYAEAEGTVEHIGYNTADLLYRL